MPAADYSTWLTKQQAADAIGVSTKTVEQLAKAQRVQQALYRRPTGGPAVAVYHPDDVARLARERQPGATAFVLPADPELPASANGDRSLRRRPAALALTPTAAPDDDVLRQVFAAALRAVTSQTSEKPPTLFVTLEEAATITGLSRTCIKRLIGAGKLEAIRDRGLRVRRRALENL